jgi:hypothetical protein
MVTAPFVRALQSSMPTRRQFIKTGLAGAVALAAGGAWFAASANDEEADALFRAVGRAVLDGVMPADGLAGMRVAIAGLSASAQAEIDQLVGLLTFPPTRLLLTGIAHSWDRATANEVAAFLQRWRSSRLNLLKSGYAALHDLALGAHYGAPQNWLAIGYAGPPFVPRAPG